MALLQWVPSLNTGIQEIDIQHRRIVDYINRLNEQRGSGNRAAQAEVIDELVDYTMSHFAFEEELMSNAGYMFLGPHKRVHEIFTRKVAEMQKRFEAGEDVLSDLHGMLSRWLFNHIRNEDHNYIDAVKAYQRMVGGSSKEDDAREPNQRQKERKGFLRRLFFGG